VYHEPAWTATKRAAAARRSDRNEGSAARGGRRGGESSLFDSERERDIHGQ